jgi:hypothetical protein
VEVYPGPEFNERTFIDWRESTGNAISCRDLGDSLELEFAESATGGPRLSFLVCGYDGQAGSFMPIDPQLGCSGGPGFNVLWHDGTQTYTSWMAEQPCFLEVHAYGATVAGSFACQPMPGDMGGSVILYEGILGCDFLP